MRPCPHLCDPGFRFCRCAWPWSTKSPTGSRLACSGAAPWRRAIPEPAHEPWVRCWDWHPWILGSGLDPESRTGSQNWPNGFNPAAALSRASTRKPSDSIADLVVEGWAWVDMGFCKYCAEGAEQNKKKKTAAPCSRFGLGLCLSLRPPWPRRTHARSARSARRPRASRCAPDRPLTLGWRRAGGRGGPERHMAAESGSITRRQSRPASHHSTNTHPGGVWHLSGVQTRRAGWCRGTAATSRELRRPRSPRQEPEISTTGRCIGGIGGIGCICGAVVRYAKPGHCVQKEG